MTLTTFSSANIERSEPATTPIVRLAAAPNLFPHDNCSLQRKIKSDDYIRAVGLTKSSIDRLHIVASSVQPFQSVAFQLVDDFYVVCRFAEFAEFARARATGSERYEPKQTSFDRR